MEQIILHTCTINYTFLTQEYKDKTVIKVQSQKELILALINHPDILCLILEPELEDEQFHKFLLALKKHFPFVHLAIFSTASAEQRVEGYHYINSNLEEPLKKNSLREFISSIQNREKRKSRRFSWPLKARITFPSGSWGVVSIHSLSSGGAFIEDQTLFPEPGMKTTLEIEFANSRLKIQGSVLEQRAYSSLLPFGFGVQFTDLSEPAKEALDRLVNDALIQTLLEPDSRPAVPTLDEDFLTMG